MRVHDPAHMIERPIELEMRGEIRRRPHVAPQHRAGEIDDDHVLRSKLRVLHTAGLDHHEARRAIDPAGVAKGESREAARGQLLVRRADFSEQPAEIRVLRVHAMPARCLACLITAAITSLYFANVSSTTCSVGMVDGYSPSVSSLKRPKPDS